MYLIEINIYLINQLSIYKPGAPLIDQSIGKDGILSKFIRQEFT